MNRTKKNYIPFLAGMATVILLACLISASLAREDPVEPMAQAQTQAGNPAPSEAGIALFGDVRVSPGELLTAENGMEIPAVVAFTDEKGAVHYYVEAETIGDILDVCTGVNYHESLNCVDFGAAPRLDEKGQVRLDTSGEPMWYAGDVKCDIDYNLTRDSIGKKVATAYGSGLTFGGLTFTTTSSRPSGPMAGETEEEWIQRKERVRQATPLKPEYGLSRGMYTETDPAEVDLDSWSGTAMKGQKFQSDEEGRIEHSFFFTPYLGEYAVLTIENTGTEEAIVSLSRPYTVGSRISDSFTSVRVPAGQKLVRAFRIDPDRPLENQLDLLGTSLMGKDIQLTLTAEQYRFGK